VHALALLRDRGDRGLERRAPLLGELAESAQQIEARLEAGRVRVEHAHDLEVLRERGAPLRDVRIPADRIDQRHARLTGPAQDLHLGLEVRAVGAGAIGDVQDPRAGEHGREQLALIRESALPRCSATNASTTARCAPAWVSRARIHSSARRARWKPGVSTSTYCTSPSTRIGYARHSVVVPGSGATRTESSCASVETMLDFPLLGWPTTAKVGAVMPGPPR
jgi:hypothetical protein